MNKLARFTVTGLVLLALVAYAFFAWSISSGSLLQDFVKFYAAADNFSQGQSLYAPVPFDRYTELDLAALEAMGQDALHPNLNLPAASLLFLPFSALSLPAAYLAWFALSLGLTLAAGWIIHSRMRREYGVGYPLVVVLLLLLAYYPTVIGLWLGQLAALALFLLAVAFAASGRGRERLAGVALGLAIVFKANLGVVLLVFLLQRRWKLALWAGATFALANLLGVLVFGLDEHLAYLEVLRGVTWQAASWNASLEGFFSRIFGGSENVPLLAAPGLGSGLSFGFSLLAVGALAWAAWTSRDGSPIRKDLAFALAIPVSLLISPLGWMYYFPALIIPAVVGWQAAGAIKRPVYRWLIALAWLLSTVPHWIVRASDVAAAEAFGWAGVYFYALVIFCGVLIALLAEPRLRADFPRHFASDQTDHNPCSSAH